jgi:hypothetical protein
LDLIASRTNLYVLGLAWATYKFRKYRRLWHAPERATATSV